jgi:hypothetical protein
MTLFNWIKSIKQYTTLHAAVAQPVERSHGKGEVTGSIPVCGFFKTIRLGCDTLNCKQTYNSYIIYMYKRLTLQQLLGIQSGLFQRLQNIYKAAKCQYLKEFLKIATKEWNDVYYMREWSGYFRISKRPDGIYIFIDEVEKIELHLNEEELMQVHNLLKWDKKVQKIMKDNQSIKATLEEEFEKWDRKTFMDKPYLVYDIETTWTTNDLKNQKFILWYMLDSTSGKYRLIEEESAQKFTDYLLKFEWWIVGFNQIWFDNPVMLYNTEFSQEKLDILNNKSIDLFYFVWQLLGRKIGLNRLSEALIGIKKTLDSWAEWSRILKEYQQTGDVKLLESVKKYCKNDVKMTLLVFLYILKYKKLYDEWEETHFTDDDILNYGQVIEEAKIDQGQQSIF